MIEATPHHDVAPHYESMHPHEIGIATATLYPGWYAGAAGAQPTADKIRGDIALQTFAESSRQGFQAVVVDGGSSEAFLATLAHTGVKIDTEKDHGMSASRRQAFASIANTEGVKIIGWTEPEKISIVRDCMPDAVRPLAEGTADIVVPHRDQAAFATYPDYQADFEISSNKLWNGILRRHGLLAQDAPDIDAWIGPRFFRNDPDIVKLFEGRYKFVSEKQSGLNQEVPELWPNALFLPLVAALKQGYRVASVDVPYRHPAEQTVFEQDSEAFRRKRAYQQESILKTTIHFIRLLEDHKHARMVAY